MFSKEEQNIRFPKSSFFEFYCNEHRMALPEYCREKNNQKPEELAEHYDEITYDIVNQVFIVEKNGKMNFVYENELEMMPVLYDFCNIYPGFAVVRKGNQTGNLFFHEGLSEPSSYRTVDVYEVKRGKYYGVEAASGDILLDCVYRFVKVYPDFILAISGEGYSMFHLDGRRMFEGCFDEIDLTTMYDDYLYIQKDEQCGVVHLRGHWIVPALFRNRDEINCCYNDYGRIDGHFLCKLNGKKGIYSEHGKLIIPFEYDNIEVGTYPFLGTKSYIVENDKKFGLFDLNGTIVFPCIYDKITALPYNNCWKISKEGTDSIWVIPDVPNNSVMRASSLFVSSSLLIDSSCYDFLKLPWYSEAFCELYAGMSDDFSDFKVDYKEAIRWLLIKCVVKNDLRYDYHWKLSRKYKELASKKSDELLSLLQLNVIRSGWGCDFSSSYQLAGAYFEGKKVFTNYRYAFEVYTYCIKDRFTDDTDRHSATFETLCNKLINDISQPEKVNVFDDCWSDEYRQCALIAHRLGWMLSTGNGVEKDEVMGMKLLNAAKAIGFVENKNVIYFPTEDNDDKEDCPF